jgi:hypothetical protein
MKHTIWIVGLFILISLSNLSEASSSKYKMVIKSLFKKMIEKTRSDGRIDLKSEGMINSLLIIDYIVGNLLILRN